MTFSTLAIEAGSLPYPEPLNPLQVPQGINLQLVHIQKRLAACKYWSVLSQVAAKLKQVLINVIGNASLQSRKHHQDAD